MNKKYPLLSAEMTRCGKTEDGEYEVQALVAGSIECFIEATYEMAEAKGMDALAAFWAENGTTNEKREARRFLREQTPGRIFRK